MINGEQEDNLYTTTIALYKQGRYEECLALLDLALSVDHGDAYLYFSRGNAKYAMQNYKGAAVDYLWSLHFDPHSFSASMNVGNAYYALKKYEKSLRWYERALDLDPQDEYIHFNLANALTKLGRLQEACDTFSKALERSPGSVASYLNRGHVRSRLGLHQAALADYQQAYALAPRESHVAWTLAWAHFGKEPLSDEDGRDLQRIARLEPDHYTSALCLGVHSLQRTDVSASLSFFERALTLAPEECGPHFWIGVAAALQGELGIAQHAIEVAIDMGLPPLLLTPLYWLRSTQGDFFEQTARALLQRFGI